MTTDAANKRPLRHFEFETRVRLLGPSPQDHTLQSVYLFNMYRAGSSVTEAVAESLAWGGEHVAWNIVRDLDAMGIGMVDPKDFSRSSAFISSKGLSFDEITRCGGYLYYGFREIPKEFALRFVYTAASVIVARDPRDIAISQFAAVKKHVVSGASGQDILRLRELTAEQQLEEFLVSDSTLSFLRRITDCYEPLLKRNCRLLRY
jgi:hypothetical protein